LLEVVSVAARSRIYLRGARSSCRVDGTSMLIHGMRWWAVRARANHRPGCETDHTDSRRWEIPDQKSLFGACSLGIRLVTFLTFPEFGRHGRWHVARRMCSIRSSRVSVSSPIPGNPHRYFLPFSRAGCQRNRNSKLPCLPTPLRRRDDTESPYRHPAVRFKAGFCWKPFIKLISPTPPCGGLAPQQVELAVPCRC